MEIVSSTSTRERAIITALFLIMRSIMRVPMRYSRAIRRPASPFFGIITGRLFSSSPSSPPPSLPPSSLSLSYTSEIESGISLAERCERLYEIRLSIPKRDAGSGGRGAGGGDGGGGEEGGN